MCFQVPSPSSGQVTSMVGCASRAVLVPWDLSTFSGSVGCRDKSQTFDWRPELVREPRMDERTQGRQEILIFEHDSQSDIVPRSGNAARRVVSISQMQNLKPRSFVWVVHFFLRPTKWDRWNPNTDVSFPNHHCCLQPWALSPHRALRP